MSQDPHAPLPAHPTPHTKAHTQPLSAHAPLEELSAELARLLVASAPWSAGELLLVRVWLEALTPGLRRFHASLKELTLRLQPADPSEAPWGEAQLTEWFKREPTLTPLFELALTHISEERQGAWWTGTREVADCGAQRDVLTRLTYKRLEATYPRWAELMGAWATQYEEAGGLKRLAQALSKDMSGAQAHVTEELLPYALRDLRAPSSLKPEELTRWLHAHRALREALYSASWSALSEAARALSALTPKCSQLLLAWSCLKAREKSFDEAFKGVKRALKVMGPSPLSEALTQDLARWELALAPPPPSEPPPPVPPDAPPPYVTLLTQSAGDEADNVKTAHTLLLSQAQGSDQGSAGRSEGGAWAPSLALLQALAALGPERAHALTARGVLAEVQALVEGARRQLSYSAQRYTEAPTLKASAQQLAHASRLLSQALTFAPERGEQTPHAYSLSHNLPHSLPHSLTPSLTPSLTGSSLTPPPLPEHGTIQAPTAVIEALSLTDASDVSPSTDAPLSLDLTGGSPLDLTADEPVSLARAQALLRSGDLTQAEHCLLALLDRNPFDPQAHNDLGVLNFQLQRFGDAKAHLILAIECDPSYEEAWENLVELFTSLGQLHHTLPLFRRFESQLQGLASFKRLQELCERFAPEGFEALAPPERSEGQEGLRLPLSGSFFLAPEAGEDPINALAAQLPSPQEEAQLKAISEGRERAQRELATQLRADVQSLLDAWQRAQHAPPPPQRGLVPWLKRKLGQEEPSHTPPALPFDDLSLSAEGVTEALIEAERAPEPVPTSPLPVDQRRVRNVAFSMLCVPSGTFLMGTEVGRSYGADQEHPRHRVVISRPFQLAQMPITQELYEAIMWVNPSHEKAPGHPVVRVNWFDAVRFCNTLSELEGLSPAYLISQGARPEVAFVAESKGYRLPLESEWEYCARARQAYRFSGGEDINEVGWVSSDELHTVGRKTSNPWGFYDMSGNVWEWCSDGLREYNSDAQLDPQGDLNTYMHTPGARVIKGGSWCFEPDGARVAFRGRGAPGLRITSLGFRVARTL